MEHLRAILDLVKRLDQEQGWNLTEAMISEYVQFFEDHEPLKLSPEVLSKRIVWYHHDHLLVICLRSSEHVEHAITWERWRLEARGVLHSSSLGWSRDLAIDIEDLLQMAGEALSKSLVSFKFESSFRTWSFQVMTNAVRRYLRDCGAQKRAINSSAASLDDGSVKEFDQPHDTFNHEVNARLLKSLIDEVLASYPDQRSVLIYKMWLEHDMRLADLGRIFGLSQSRVSILLDQIRTHLQNDPRIQEWKE